MIIPVLHRIIVKPDNLEEVDETYIKAKQLGIEIASLDDKVRKQASVDKGRVVLIGETAFKDFGAACPIREGDYIAYASFSGKQITDPFTQEKFVALNDEDVVCVFKE